MKLIYLTACVFFVITMTKASEFEGFEEEKKCEDCNDIDQSEVDDALAPSAATAASLCSINEDALDARIKNVIDLKFKNQPGMDISLVLLYYF